MTNKTFFGPAVVFLFSLVLRLSLISKGPYNVDTLNLVLQAEQTLATRHLHYLIGWGYPLTVLLGSAFILCSRFFGGHDPVFAVNLLSVVFSSLSVMLAYLLAKELFNETSALLSATLFSVCPIFLGISVYGKSHAPAVFFLLLGLLLLLRHLKTSGGWPSLTGAGLAFGAMGAARMQDLILLTPAIAFLFFQGHKIFPFSPCRTRKTTLKRSAALFLFTTITAVSFHLPYLLPGNNAYMQNLSRFWLPGSYLGIISSRLLLALSHLAFALTPAGLLLAAASLTLVLVRQRTLGLFLIFWLMGPLVLYGNHRYIINPRFLAVLLPPLFWAQGYVLALAIKRFPRAKMLTAVFFLSLVGILYGRVYPQIKFRHDHALLPDFTRWVAASTEPRARVIVADEALFFKYYTSLHLLGRPASVLYAGETELRRFQTEIDGLLARGVPVYITTASLYAYDRDGHFSSFFNTNYQKDYIGSHWYEDWHLGTFKQQVFLFDLFRVHRKARPGRQG